MTNPKEALEWYERKRVEARAMADRDCSHCKHNKADGCSRWNCEYEPRMDDLISRQDAIEAIATVTMSIHLSNVLCDKLLALPSADRPTGEWIKSNILPNGWHCSHCDAPVMTDDIEEMLFCPHCGSYNGGEEE